MSLFITYQTERETKEKVDFMRLPIVKIRLKILKTLKIMPMSVYDVSVAIGVSYKATLRNLKYLEDMGKIEYTTIEALNKTLWRIKKHDE